MDEYASTKTTINNGVCIKSTRDYFGELQEVIEVGSPGFPKKKTVLFKCGWFDPSD